jgi:putative toxin-antitoxin system antitoxin component (TIGR02293 family)
MKRTEREVPFAEWVEEAPVVYACAREQLPHLPRKTPLDSEEKVIEQIQAGLAMAEFEALRWLLDLTGEELAEKLAISRSTLIRRRKTGRLDREESDRLVRFARLFARAAAVFGGEVGAREWLKSPASGLNFRVPLAYAETEAGAREVEALLGRIDYGVLT